MTHFFITIIVLLPLLDLSMTHPHAPLPSLRFLLYLLHQITDIFLPDGFVYLLQMDWMIDVLYDLRSYFKIVVEILVANETVIATGGEVVWILIIFGLSRIGQLMAIAVLDL